MLYVLVGSDFTRRVSRTHKILKVLQTKRPGSLYIEFNTDTFRIQSIEQFVSSVGLFDEKSIIRLQGVCEDVEYKKYLLDHASTLSESNNAFVITEGSLTKNELSKFEKAGATIEQFDLQEKRDSANLFNLGDLLLTKNKQRLLIQWHEYLRSGHTPEELMGIMVWQIKSLNAALSFSQKDSGLKPFVYNKCAQSNWNKNEAQKAYHNLITLYHESRRGGLTLSERMEWFILEL